MLSIGLFTADQADEYLGDTGWLPAIEGRRNWRAKFLAELLGAAFTLPSLVAEVTPLVLFWNDHLPVWQMSSMMFGAWALVWWLTWISHCVAVEAQPLIPRRIWRYQQGAHRWSTSLDPITVACQLGEGEG
jgi:hypothetical protein